MANVNLSYLLNLKPEEIIKWFESKGNVISWDWHEVYREAHAKAFTVAKVMDLDILQTIRDEVKNIFDKGTTPQEFRKNLEPTLKKLGWWGKQKAKDVPGFNPKSGVDPEKVVQLGSPYRLDKIFRINSSVAYNSSRYKFQMDNISTHPYLQYIQIQRPSKRDAHAKYNGKVFRADDPIWNTIYPPSDWECGCRVVAKSKDDLTQEGLKVSKGKDFDTSDIPEEWSGNPGQAAFFPDLNKYDYDIATQYLRGGLTSPDFDLFYDGKIKGNYPVAVIDPGYQKLIKANTKVVNLSDETLSKNITNHPDIEKQDYQNLPTIIAGAQLIVQDGDNTFVFLKQNGNVYYGAIKATKTGNNLFLTSFRFASNQTIDEIKKKGKVLKDDL
jgi:SPP1 gp7 family putative phage head morphogenesis protein